MKLKTLIIVSLLFLIFASGMVSANENLTDIAMDNHFQDSAAVTVDGRTFNDIQTKISSVNDGDVVELDGTYGSSSKNPITVSKSITIRGKNNATLDGKNSSSILKVKSKSLTLKDLTFTNSYNTVITSDDCDLNIINCTFIKNNAGSIYYDDEDRQYTVGDCYVGLIDLTRGKLTLSDSLITDNNCNLYYLIHITEASFSILNTTFTNHYRNPLLNDIPTAIAADCMELYSTGIISNCSFKNNQMQILNSWNNTVQISNSLFDNDYKGVYIMYGMLEVSNSTFRNCSHVIESRWMNKIDISKSQFLKTKLYCILFEGEILNIENTGFENNDGSVIISEGITTVKNCIFKDNIGKKGTTFYSESHWNKTGEYLNKLTLIDSNIINSYSTVSGSIIFAKCLDVHILNTNISSKPSSNGPQVYIEVGKFTSVNSTNLTAQIIDKIPALITEVWPKSSTYNSGKKIYFIVVYDNDYDDASIPYAQIAIKVYTSANKYVTYYSNPKYVLSDPYFVIDSKIGVGKHKVEVTPVGKYFTFKKFTTTITIKKAKTIVKAPKLTAKYKKSKYFKVTVKNKARNKVVVNLKIKIKVFTGKKSKSYIVKTNKKGIAKINTKNLKRGKHNVKITSKDKNYEISKKSSIKIK